ncbi:HotDog domain-containing protein [Cokeromyces recurvatus]|uniref:HotDog domain-containing protein n=1 Tax=Cokeromyces recurvatus TaxID=90255 RepID=UPI00221E866F|nr:HotDog domain-containing protein [Cokeromyces recurvatus]KAI7902440.1 HotDog domain-containing protein [Cokeromyces recurvatus]
MTFKPTITEAPFADNLSRHSSTSQRVPIAEEKDILSPEEEELKRQESELSLVKDLRNSSDWYETISHGHLSPSAKQHSLTAHSLRGPHKILRRPLKFFNKDKTMCIVILHVGDHLCDKKERIHNGLLAALLDEHLAFVTLPSLPNYTGFTANLNVDYLNPVAPNQWLIVRGILNRVEGRKAYAEAWIENVDGERMAEAKALYISPRTQN